MASYADMTSGRRKDEPQEVAGTSKTGFDISLDDLDDVCLLPGAELFGLRPPLKTPVTSSLNAAAAIFEPSKSAKPTGTRPKYSADIIESLNESLKELTPLTPGIPSKAEAEVQTEQPVLMIKDVAPEPTIADEVVTGYTDLSTGNLEDAGDLENLCRAFPEYREAMAAGCFGPSAESIREDYRKARQVLGKQMKHLEIAQQLLQNEFDRNNILLDELIERSIDFALRAKIATPTRQDCEDFCNRMFTLRVQTLLGWQNRDPDQKQRFYDVKHKYVQTQETYHHVLEVITNHVRREEYLRSTELIRKAEKEAEERIRDLEVQQREREAAEELEQLRLVELQELRGVEQEKLRQLAQNERRELKRVLQADEQRQQAAFYSTPTIPPEMIPRPRKHSFQTIDAEGNPQQFGRMSPLTEEERSFEIEDRLRRSKKLPNEPEVPLTLTQDNPNLVSFMPPSWRSRPPPTSWRRQPDSETGSEKK